MIFITIQFSSFAQYTIKGVVLDSNTLQPLGLVHVFNTSNNSGTITNDNGEFVLHCNQLPVRISISHVSYHTFSFLVEKNNENLKILLKESEILLPELTVVSNKPINITKNKKIYVIDYDFVGDSIVLLSYKNQKLSKPCLVVLTKEGDTLQSKALSKMDYLFKDCLDNEHIIEKDYARQLYFNNNNIELIYPSRKDSFLSIFSIIIENYNQFFYLRQNTQNNQIVNYYVFDKSNDSIYLMRQIVDEAGLVRLSDKGRLQNSEGYTDADARFEEMCFYAPKNIELIKTKNNIIVFNFPEDLMEFYEFNGKFICDKKIEFHKSDDWAKKIIMDEKNGKLYSLYQKNGIFRLKEINCSTGKTAESEYKIPDLAFIQKIKIYDNKIYFLYNDFTEYDYKQLYCLKM